MKKTVFVILVILVAIQSVGLSQKKIYREQIKTDTVSADSMEYRLIIMDPGFDSWLETKPSKDFYSNEYYAQKNRLYVAEWNQRYLTLHINDLYDNYIEYKPNTDYGIDINYRLYYYFRYFEEKNHIKLLDYNR
jgi:Family of unknown function (DUF6146)